MNYQQEYPIGIYSLDFAWIHKKKTIEIDGCQHERFDEYRERDKKKEQLLLDEGWQLLRIRWSDMYKDTKLWIEKAKEFVGV